MAIGTAAAVLGGASLLGGVAQGVFGAKGAKAQAGAANNAAQAQLAMFNQNREDLAPYRQTGGNALEALRFEVLGGPRPVMDRSIVEKGGKFRIARAGGGLNPTAFGNRNQAQREMERQGERNGLAYQGFQESPGYQFAFDEGVRGIDRSASARGMLNSGATIKAQTRFGQGIANQEYGNYVNRLASLAGVGQSATNATAALGASAASNQGNALMQAGQARASGYNAIGNAFNSTINNGIGIAAYGGYL